MELWFDLMLATARLGHASLNLPDHNGTTARWITREGRRQSPFAYRESSCVFVNGLRAN